MDTCENGEVYNMAIRGGNEGGLDGIDVWSDNVWIHDVSYLGLFVEFLLTHGYPLDRSHKQGRMRDCQGKSPPNSHGKKTN